MFIAIEGIDGAGKATQTALLAERFASEGKSVGTLAFPAYGSWSAVFAERYLRHELLEPKDGWDSRILASFYTFDRIGQLGHITTSLQTHDIVLSDRYSPSNFAYSGASLWLAGREVELDDFFAWLWDWEFIRAKLPMPDRIIFLDMPPQTAIELRAKRLGVQDRNEKNTALQEAVRHVITTYFPRLFGDRFIPIACVTPGGALLSPQSIAESVWQVLRTQ